MSDNGNEKSDIIRDVTETFVVGRHDGFHHKRAPRNCAVRRLTHDVIVHILSYGCCATVMSCRGVCRPFRIAAIDSLVPHSAAYLWSSPSVAHIELVPDIVVSSVMAIGFEQDTLNVLCRGVSRNEIVLYRRCTRTMQSKTYARIPMMEDSIGEITAVCSGRVALIGNAAFNLPSQHRIPLPISEPTLLATSPSGKFIVCCDYDRCCVVDAMTNEVISTRDLDHQHGKGAPDDIWVGEDRVVFSFRLQSDSSIWPRSEDRTLLLAYTLQLDKPLGRTVLNAEKFVACFDHLDSEPCQNDLFRFKYDSDREAPCKRRAWVAVTSHGTFFFWWTAGGGPVSNDAPTTEMRDETPSRNRANEQLRRNIFLEQQSEPLSSSREAFSVASVFSVDGMTQPTYVIPASSELTHAATSNREQTHRRSTEPGPGEPGYRRLLFKRSVQSLPNLFSSRSTESLDRSRCSGSCGDSSTESPNDDDNAASPLAFTATAEYEIFSCHRTKQQVKHFAKASQINNSKEGYEHESQKGFNDEESAGIADTRTETDTDQRFYYSERMMSGVSRNQSRRDRIPTAIFDDTHNVASLSSSDNNRKRIAHEYHHLSDIAVAVPGRLYALTVQCLNPVGGLMSHNLMGGAVAIGGGARCPVNSYVQSPEIRLIAADGSFQRRISLRGVSVCALHPRCAILVAAVINPESNSQRSQPIHPLLEAIEAGVGEIFIFGKDVVEASVNAQSRHSITSASVEGLLPSSLPRSASNLCFSPVIGTPNNSARFVTRRQQKYTTAMTCSQQQLSHRSARRWKRQIKIQQRVLRTLLGEMQKPPAALMQFLEWLTTLTGAGILLCLSWTVVNVAYHAWFVRMEVLTAVANVTL